MDKRKLLKTAAKAEFKKFYLKKIAAMLIAEALMDRTKLGL